MSDFWRGKRVLVTGGAGFVGSALTRKLLEAGSEVRVADIVDPEVHGNLRGIEDRIRRAGDTSLGFTPKIGLEDGFRRTVDWYRSSVIERPQSTSVR